MNIGPIHIERPLCLAPMEDVTDAAFRLVCKQFGADLVYTEFTSSEAVIRDIPRAMRKIKIYEEERPVAIQLFGGVEQSMTEAARIAESLGPDFIDINCGCWVKNHVARGEGAALLKNLPHFERVVRATVQGTKLPVTVKTRLGWDDDSIVILDVAKMVEQAGAQALTIHCRTRAQGHEGEARWSWLEKIKKAVSIPIIGNGDVRSPEDVKRMFETGCDGVMIGRAAIGNPWIFKHAREYLETGRLPEPPSLSERVEVCLTHLKQALRMKGVRGGLIPFRKFYAGYFKGVPNVSKVRSVIMQSVEFDHIAETLYQFSRKEEVCVDATT